MKISVKPFQVINESHHDPSLSRPYLSVHKHEIKSTITIQIVLAFAPGLLRVLVIYKMFFNHFRGFPRILGIPMSSQTSPLPHGFLLLCSDLWAPTAVVMLEPMRCQNWMVVSKESAQHSFCLCFVLCSYYEQIQSVKILLWRQLLYLWLNISFHQSPGTASRKPVWETDFMFPIPLSQLPGTSVTSPSQASCSCRWVLQTVLVGTSPSSNRSREVCIPCRLGLGFYYAGY